VPTWSANFVRPVRNRKSVTECPSGSAIERLSTAIAPPTVETGIQPGCSVVVVVVGGMVVAVVTVTTLGLCAGAELTLAAAVEQEVRAKPAMTSAHQDRLPLDGPLRIRWLWRPEAFNPSFNRLRAFLDGHVSQDGTPVTNRA
jgi:hypothetical protein